MCEFNCLVKGKQGEGSFIYMQVPKMSVRLYLPKAVKFQTS